ncbi:hypothetical protein NECAME_15449 [Necator americanus]|uniref:Uncharacterized protein n=1 Tax=Necator americanus TaxID=51031 RepID=W2SKE2_NECAM|nr:hypothetical protein NECAME_15449 [Necator americanus]ETN69207.1 hypothetical protein NECAME_15449 [Necator americanus]
MELTKRKVSHNEELCAEADLPYCQMTRILIDRIYRHHVCLKYPQKSFALESCGKDEFYILFWIFANTNLKNLQQFIKE